MKRNSQILKPIAALLIALSLSAANARGGSDGAGPPQSPHPQATALVDMPDTAEAIEACRTGVSVEALAASQVAISRLKQCPPGLSYVRVGTQASRLDNDKTVCLAVATRVCGQL